MRGTDVAKYEHIPQLRLIFCIERQTIADNFVLASVPENAYPSYQFLHVDITPMIVALVNQKIDARRFSG